VGESLAFLADVDATNLRRRAHVVELAQELLGGAVSGKRVAVLGLAFKPNSDDVRDSPALDIAGRLQELGATVAAYDPEAVVTARRVRPELEYVEQAADALRGADLVLVLTEWDEFRGLDAAEAATLVANPVVIDGRNCLDRDAWTAAGFTYRGMGR
jgi:UDPglucose 6-dehydrogenase